MRQLQQQLLQQKAGRLRRILAAGFDGFFVSLLIVLILIGSGFISGLTVLVPLGPFTLVLLGISGYFVFLESHIFGGQTLGARCCGIAVRTPDGKIPSPAQAILRYIGMWLSMITLGLGFLLGLGPTRRTLADRLSGTVVVLLSDPPQDDL